MTPQNTRRSAFVVPRSSNSPNAMLRDFHVHDCTLRHFCNLSISRLRTVLRWRNNPLIAQHMLNTKPIPLTKYLQFCKKLAGNCADAYWMALRDRRGLGVINLKHVDRQRRRAFLGMYANPRLIGSGIGGLLLQCIEHIAFTHLGLRELYLQVRRENSRARSLYQKHGYVEVPSPEDRSSQDSPGTMITMYKRALHHPDE